MRTTILLCTLLILAGCSTAPHPEAPPEGVRQPDSPIIITDGSIRFHKHNGFTPTSDPTHIKAVIDTTKQWVFEVMGCKSPPAPTCKPTPLDPGSWTVTIHDTDGTVAATLTRADGTTNIVDIWGKSPFSNTNGDAIQSGSHLHHSKVNGGATPFDCPPGSAAGSKPCEVQIHTQ
jgi:hypothetical protein